ncbi:hypothetical protein IU433_12390 [Nocardia puris]|uniref:hypothetical protein n=1 Tax=Nocardia puris TaxID=208602 RepID=UPI001894C1ED|nr:hypothetical protein [Nocardia puris]MBF6459836.1 hypothetical protein [Nocardia puris]
MILLGHLIQLSYVGVLGVIGLGIAIHHRGEPPHDCPFCRGDGCERCGWSGEVTDAELASVRDGSCDGCGGGPAGLGWTYCNDGTSWCPECANNDDESVPEDPDRARDWAIADDQGVF